MKLRKITLPDGTKRLEVIQPASEEIENRKHLHKNIEKERKEKRLKKLSSSHGKCFKTWNDYKKYIKETSVTIREKNKSEIRFWRDVDKTSENGCHMWTGDVSVSGYGKFFYNGRTMSAHRVSLIVQGIDIPEGSIIMHTCNNKLCVNKEHLKIGTFLENSQYMVACNRQAKGEKAGNSKLKSDMVNEIRMLYSSGKYSQRKLAKRFNVSKSTIQSIVTNVTWIANKP